MNMRFMKNGILGVLSCSVILLLAPSCEWTGGGGVEQFNERYSFLNFSGVYRGINGGVLVTDFTATPGTDGVPASTNQVNGERIAQGNGSDTSFAGVLDDAPLVLGSLTISVPDGYTFTDETGSGILTGQDGASGTIDYNTGQWTLDFAGVAIDDGDDILASYLSITAAVEGDPNSETGPGPGTTGITIYSFTVEHIGNVLNIVDNNGSVYSGNFGDIRSAGGVSQDNTDTITVSAGDEFIASFEVSGVSASGFNVTMVGTFQAVVQATGSATAVLDDRLMFGTWIEEGGRTGDINGEASPVTVSVSTTSAAEAAAE